MAFIRPATRNSVETRCREILFLATGFLVTTFLCGLSVGAQPFPARIDLGSITGEDGIILNGINSGDDAGFRVAGIGDLDDDGLGDVAVTAINADANGSSSGEIYILFGNTSVVSPILDLEDLDGTNGFRIDGIGSGDTAGSAVDAAGDVNGDGIDDLILGAQSADPNGTSSGEAYVIFGDPTFPASIQLSDIDGSNGFQINGANSFDSFGDSVAGIGDFDDDGFDDILIGAPEADPNGTSSGTAYLIFGKESFPRAVELELNGNNGFQINGIDSNDDAGTAISGAGDVNADGFDDLILGAPFADPNGGSSGEAYIVFGRGNDMPPSVELDDINGTNGVRLEGIDSSDFAGIEVRGAGDLNQDGFDDVLVAATDADPNGSSSGETYVVFGHATFPEVLQLFELDGTSGFVLNGVSNGDDSGVSAAGAGDYNGDGFGDMVIGAPFADPNGTSSGESYVVFGGPGTPDAIELENLNGANGLTYEGPTGADQSGFSVDTAGDFNGDGVDDIVIGGPEGNGSSGFAHILLGRTETGITVGATGGSCPGTIRLRSKGLTENGVFGLYRGSRRGTTVISNGVCSGFELDLENAVLISQLQADSDGLWTFAAEINSQGACGQAVQVIDLTGCVLSNVTTLPEE